MFLALVDHKQEIHSIKGGATACQIYTSLHFCHSGFAARWCRSTSVLFT